MGYLSNKDDPPTTVNGATQTVCKAIQTSVCGSAGESEYAAQLINGAAGCHALNILSELGYPQSNAKMYSDNLVAKGIANDEITIRKSKALHTRHHDPRQSSPGTIHNCVSARSQTTSRLLHKATATNQAKTLCLTTHGANELDCKDYINI